jgi:Zn-dependent metalloprotease
LFLLGLMVLPAYAFRNSEDKASLSDAGARPQTNRVIRVPSARQLSAAETGGKLGVKVAWHSQLSTPSSIRGANLGQRQAFSGGKGLSLRGGRAYQDDSVAVLDNLASFYRIKDAKKEFAVRKVDPDTLGFHHVRVNQTHQGLRVVGGALAVHFNTKGQAYEVNGQYVPDIDVSVIPSITAEVATQIAQADLKSLENPIGTLTKAPELVVFARDTEPRLAYEITLAYRVPGANPGRWRYWIDGLQGKILLRYNDIKRISPPTSNGTNSVITGSILAGEGGSVTNVPGWYENSGSYYLYNKTLNWCVYNVATTNRYADFNTYAYRTTADWGVSDRTEMSAACGFEQIQRYFSQVHGLNSFDGSGAFARANVHEGVDYVNAYWDGDAFYFGDGDGLSANSLAVLDIAGHEYTHAVTDYSANLIYYSESGALNESFSDIFGSCVEFFSQKDDRASYPARTPGQADWLCGEDSWLETTALRDIRNPANSATVGANNEQPTRYKGTYWYFGTGDNAGVHYNSGVQNFLFYLLCEGGSGTNDGLAYNMTGIGITNAEKVAYRALTVYCTDHTDYRAARSAWMSAAQDLNLDWVGSVSAAWDAVGIQAVTITPESGSFFSGFEGGPFSPTTFVYTLINASASEVGWGVSHLPAWVSVSSASGSIPAFGSQTVAVTPNGTALGQRVGEYADTLVFTNTASSVSEIRSVVLRVQPPVIYAFSLDTDPGWTAEGQWAYGMPLGFGNDPSAGATGTKVYGYNLAGAYSNNMPIYALTTHAIDCSHYDNIQLSFQRWLGVERATYDHATIQVSTDAMVWSNVWNNVDASLQDTSWMNCVYSLPLAAGQRTVYLRWLMGPTDSSDTYSGWNIDDISILGTSTDGMRVLPSGDLVSQRYEGGPFSPTNKTYLIINGGSASFTWTAATTSAWLTVSSPGGTLAAGATATVSVAFSPAANALAPGQYQGGVVFANTTSGLSTSRSVSLTVLVIPGEIDVWDSIAPNSDTNMPFDSVIVGKSRTEQVIVSNTDPTYPLIISDIVSGWYQEDFNDGQVQGWTEIMDPQWDVVEGEYRSQDLTSDSEMQSVYGGDEWQDCAVRATFRRTGGMTGAQVLILRASQDFSWVMPYAGSGYDIGISGDGYFYVGKTVGGAWSMLQDWTVSPFLNTGTVANTILVNNRGSLIEVYFNGDLAWSGVDTSISGKGHVGFAALSQSSGVAQVNYFDDVAVGEARLASLKSNEGSAAREGMFSDGFALTGLPTFPYTVLPGSNLTFNVIYAPQAVGSNTFAVVIKSADADEPTVAVTLSGKGIPDYMDVQPLTGLSGRGPPGGSFMPANQSYTVSNNNAVAISWAAVGYPAWVSVTPDSGTLPAGTSASVLVAFNAAAIALPQGDYSGALVFSNLTTSITQTRALALAVFLTPVVQVAPVAITVTNRLRQTLQTALHIGNAAWANATMNFTLSASEVARTLAPATVQPAIIRDFTQLPKDAKYCAGELLVRFNTATTGVTARAQVLAAAGGGSIAREFKLVPRLVLVTLPEGAVMADALIRFNQTAGILYAQPNYLKKALRMPNDTYFSYLWGMHNTGQTGGVPNADIDAPEAWESGVGGASVKVAVIDTGIDYNHEDLAANMWINTGEIPGNGIDDDNNGYVDDVHGYDFFNRDGDPMDDHGHGTHCSGTIGAVGNNGVGVAGVCWNVKIMALKFLSAAGEGDTAGAISCMEYAVRMGARVFNNSWGDVPGGPYEQALKDAIDATGAANVLFIAAAGNDANNNDVNPAYPASYASDNIISVMSVSSTGARSSFSNYGQQSVDLAAPGSSIVSCKLGGGYQYMSGTSMATPHVVGACALLLSLNSGYSAQQVKHALMATTDSSQPGLCVSGGLMKLANAITLSPAWLRMMPFSGANMAPGVSSNITVTTDAGLLAAGIYEGLIRVDSNDHDTPVTNVPVTMVVLSDDLKIQPSGAFVSSGYTGGPFSPSNMVYTLTNAGLVSLTWAASCEYPWGSVTPAGGTLVAGQATHVSVSFAALAGLLSPGEFSNNVFFSNVTTTIVQQRGISLTVLERTLDHFVWNDIASTQYVGRVFGVTAQAIDTTGQVLTNFTGTVALNVSTGVGSQPNVLTGTNAWNYPTTTGHFINGVWRGDVTVLDSVTNARLYANDGVGHGGLSNPFDVLFQTIGLPEAVDCKALTWTTGGVAAWFGQTVVSYDGVDSARNERIGNREASWMETQAKGPCTASFWWRVSSEAGWDWLEFYVDGVLSDRITGETGWLQKVTALTAGTHTLRWRYVKDGVDIDPVGGDCGWVDTFIVDPLIIDLPEAVDNTTVSWTTGGSAEWQGQALVSHDGVDAAKSGTIGNRQASWMETQVAGPGNASFWWRVSSEVDWDWLELYVDGALSDRITGETGWLQKNVTLATGLHTLKWRYVKDGVDIGPVGQDCGWVDMFSTPSQSALPSAWLLQFDLPTDGSADYIDSDNDGMSNWEEWMAGTVPTNPLSFLQIESLTPESESGGFRIRWQSVPEKYYWVGSCENLTEPIFFTPFVSNVLGQAESTMVLDARPATNGSRFYRIGVQ